MKILDNIDNDSTTYDYNLKRVSKEFYIDRLGNVHKYKGSLKDDIISMHYHIAHKLFPKLDYPDDHVMKLGWILCGSTVYHCPIIHIKPTVAQIQKLRDLDLYMKLCFLYIDTYASYNKFGAILN